MKTTITSLIAFLIQLTAFGQEFEFDIHNKHLKDLLKVEESLGSEPVPNTAKHISEKGIAQPVKFLRKQSVIPDLISQYFFYEKDSSIAKILYEWDVYNFDEKDNNKQPAKVQKALIKKYNAIEKEMTAKFGEGSEEGSLIDLDQINDREGLTKRNTWKPNDSTEIEMYTSISNFYEKKGRMTINPTHRIRLYIRNTANKRDNLLKLDEGKIQAFNQVTISFLTALRQEKYEESKLFLSDLIVEQVNIEQLKALRENVDFEKEIQPFFNGIQIGPNGDTFSLIQYKYASDTSTPPKEMIKVVFDSNEKILGIQPFKFR